MTVEMRRRSIPEQLRYAADQLETAGEVQRIAIAFGLRRIADELCPTDGSRA